MSTWYKQTTTAGKKFTHQVPDQWKDTSMQCNQCGKNLSEEQERTRLLNRRKYKKAFCSNQCAADHKKKRLNRLCESCGAGIEVIPSLGNRKRFCSQKCKDVGYRNDRINAWLSNEKPINGDNIQMKTREWLLEYFSKTSGIKCASCGENHINPHTGRSILQIDHINGNSLDNSPGNLRLLCPNCHAKTPTWGYLNNGRGRKRRK